MPVASTLLQGGALEAFDDGVVVRRALWDAVVLENFGGEVDAEPGGDVIGTVVG